MTKHVHHIDGDIHNNELKNLVVVRAKTNLQGNAMSKPKSIYVTDRSMSALRPGDALSGRMNQIVDRYLMMLEMNSANVRLMFNPDEWEKLLEFCPIAGVGSTPAADIRGDLLTRIGAWPELARHVDALDGGEFVTLLELLEGDRIGRALLAG